MAKSRKVPGVYAQYLRLNVHVTASNRTLITKAHRRMLSNAGRSRAMRSERHRWLHALLSEHTKAFIEYAYVMGGR